MRTRVRTTMLAAIALVGLLVLTGCLGPPSDEQSGGGPANGPDDGPTELEMAEVREYEGQNLSSIADFRENSILGPQEVDIDDYRLKITGLVDEPLELTYEETTATLTPYKKVVRLNCVEGWSVDILWEGVKMVDLLDKAGADPDADVIILKAVDGYSTSLPADFIRDNDILLAYKMNDVTLPPVRGFPFQLVAEEKWGYKWIKWVEEIEVSNDTSYQGYWESRGYSNTGDLEKGPRED